MITALRPYSMPNRQQQNFKRILPQDCLDDLKKGKIDSINRLWNLVPSVYTEKDNKEVVEQIFRAQETVMTESLKKLAKRFNIKID